MKVKNDVLMWERHELGASIRTCFDCPIFSSDGEKVGILYGTKKAGFYRLPPEAKYLVKRYFTNRGYPDHEVLELPSLKVIATVDRNTSPEEVLSFDLPEGVKEYLLKDCFGE